MVTPTGQKVQVFYNKTPFPDYELERFNSKYSLVSATYPFAKVIDRSIPPTASVIDVGTGTGQLSSFLSLKRENVWGIDFSDASINKANALKKNLKLDTLVLKKVDILDEKQIEEINMKFDYILCLGVLHHTGDAYRAFQNILKLGKPGTKIAIGLYNNYGRIQLKVRKILAKTLFKNNDKVKDYFIRMQIGDVEDKERARGWWNDQYNHPHETSHTIGEVLGWFKKNNIEFIRTVPSSTPFNNMSQVSLEIAGLWNGNFQSYPSSITRMYKQLSWIWRTNKEGGYWITFGEMK